MLIRTHTCGELRETHVGQTVNLNGWVNAFRDHGPLIFIDVRDRYGITQLVFDKEDLDKLTGGKETLDLADKLRTEYVIAIKGAVRVRVADPNPKLATGKIEVVVTELELLNKTETPPFLPDDYGTLPRDEVRLKHRYIDLRRPRMQSILSTRHKVMKVARTYFDENGFLEVETPILYKSTPEGAREFVVPCRNMPGTFYALPQSPQLFKQILMMSGCDRYMQICRCFRDEDPRADRQAEFSQIDLEMSFVRREQIMNMMEGFVRRLFGDVLGVTVPTMQRMPYRECLERFGIDRPDTRYGLEITDISPIAAKSDFKVFKDALAKSPAAREFYSKRGYVKAIRVPAGSGTAGGAEKLTRKLTDGYSEWVKTFGAGGVAVSKVIKTPDGAVAFETGCAKFLEPIKAELLAAMNLAPGDAILIVADTYAVATKTLGELRQKVARDIGLVPEWGKMWNFLWMIDPPMFERNKDTGKWVALHHPFTSPRDDQAAAFVAAAEDDDETIESILSAGYDVVLNGSEIGGGSIRIHDPSVQSKVFSLLGLNPQQTQEKFGFLLEALKFGAPPHGGVAFGLDRLVMHLVGTDDIKDVIAFPKTQIGADLLTKAPSMVPEAQQKELYIKSTWVPPPADAPKPTA